MTEQADENETPISDGSTDEDLPPNGDQPESGVNSFTLLVVAMLVLVGGSVYFAGQVLSSKDDTTRAQESAEAQIAEFDPSEFTSELIENGTTPSSLALIGDDQDDADSAAQTPRSTTTTVPIARPGVDPSTIALAFINRVPGDEYGYVGYIDSAGDRHVTELECDRLDINEAGGICLSATAGFGGGGRGLLLDAGFNAQLKFGVNQPSRAAVSPDGGVVAWTGFTLGHSYLVPGEFATTTQLISVDRGVGANLETIFATFDIDGGPLNAEDRNYWGVTFLDSDRFYATVGYENTTSIVAGTISNSRLDIVYENASCPEVSPDGRTIVAKEFRDGVFQLVAIDVVSGARRDLGETRSVDDQVEWADDDNILYALPNVEEGTDAQPVFDVWALNVAPGSVPQLVIPFADSPAS
ncbi:MAG: hypothetical protein ACI81L_001846 [Verrucomicrobiales bacterium]|jgi:hypothetical protein